MGEIQFKFKFVILCQFSFFFLFFCCSNEQFIALRQQPKEKKNNIARISVTCVCHSLAIYFLCSFRVFLTVFDKLYISYSAK